MLIISIAKIVVYFAFVLAYSWLAGCYAKGTKVPAGCYLAFSIFYAVLAVCLATELAFKIMG